MMLTPRTYLEEMMILHKFPVWLSRTVEKLSKCWNTRVVATTKQGRQTSEPIRFLKGLPKGDALCPRLFTVCLSPIAWTISASEGYKLSMPISEKLNRPPVYRRSKDLCVFGE